jgi:hypothetical protein
MESWWNTPVPFWNLLYYELIRLKLKLTSSFAGQFHSECQKN